MDDWGLEEAAAAPILDDQAVAQENIAATER